MIKKNNFERFSLAITIKMESFKMVFQNFVSFKFI